MFTKGAMAAVQTAELLYSRLDQTIAAENTRKARKSQSNRVLHIGRILFAKDARYMKRDRLELEEKKEKGREGAREKTYENVMTISRKSVTTR